MLASRPESPSLPGNDKSLIKGPAEPICGAPAEIALKQAIFAGLPHRRYSCEMRPLRYSINVKLDGCCDHRAIIPDEDLHRHAVENIEQADAFLFGRVIYTMMETAWRRPAPARCR
jgi:hypothetical protein